MTATIYERFIDLFLTRRRKIAFVPVDELYTSAIIMPTLGALMLLQLGCHLAITWLQIR